MKWRVVGGLIIAVMVGMAFFSGYVRGQQQALQTAEIHFNIIEAIVGLELQDLQGAPLPGNRIWLGDIRRGDSRIFQFQALNVGTETIGLQHSFLNLPAAAAATITVEPVPAVSLLGGESQVYTLSISVPLTALLSNDIVFQVEFHE